MEKLKPYLTYILVALVIAVTGFYVWQDWRFTTSTKDQAKQEDSITASTTSTTASDGVVIEQVSIGDSKIPMPDLNKPVVVAANLDESLKSNMLAKIKLLSAELKQNPKELSSWIELGIYKKTVGDYKGAEEIWTYVTKVNPTGIVAFNNLGNLYTYYIKDNKLAEENFLKAISLEPDKVFLYNSLYDLYRYNFKDDTKARAILEKGIAANPYEAGSLKYLLDNF